VHRNTAYHIKYKASFGAFQRFNLLMPSNLVIIFRYKFDCSTKSVLLLLLTSVWKDEKASVNLAVVLRCRKTTRCRAEGSSIWVCWDTSTERCLLCTTPPDLVVCQHITNILVSYMYIGLLGSRVVSVLDSGAERPGFKSRPRRCRVTVLGKLFTPIVHLFTKQRN